MTVLPIRLFGDPVLRTRAAPVTSFDKEIRTLVADLTETMLEAPGAGLAAPQLGVGLRVFTYHIDEQQQGHLINPVLHFPTEDDQDGAEGCLSIPGLSFDCRRRAHVVAHGQNMWGDPVTVEGTALLARCIQHETDHLDGVLFVQRLDPETKKAAMKAIREAEWFGLPTNTAMPQPAAAPITPAIARPAAQPTAQPTAQPAADSSAGQPTIIKLSPPELHGR